MGSGALAVLAHRAWVAMGVVTLATAAAYGLTYFRTLRMIVEEPDIQPRAGRALWMPTFGTPTVNAVVRFSVWSLFRSRQHRLISAFYAGLAFAVLTIVMKQPDATVTNPWREVSVGALVTSYMLMVLMVAGLRITFSLPLNLPANWIFRAMPIEGGATWTVAYRRALWVLAAGPIWLMVAVLVAWMWPWRAAWGHLAIFGMLAACAVEVCLLGNRKIPFACSWLPGKTNLHITSLMCSAMVFIVFIGAAKAELGILKSRAEIGLTVMTLAVVAGGLYWRNWRAALKDAAPLRFEEEPAWQLISLNLPSDGGA